VQQLDVNNLVCFRTVNQADHDVVLKSLFLLTRFETEKGIMLLLHGLDPSRLEDDFTTIAMVGKAEVWQDDFRWVLLEDEADGCRMSYGGLVLVEQPWEQFWLCEVLLIVLRWESAVLYRSRDSADVPSSRSAFALPLPHCHFDQTPARATMEAGNATRTAPKRPMSAYLYFCMQAREAIQRDLPGVSFQQIGIEFGNRWRQLTDEEHRPFDELAAADTQRYEREMADFVEE
ncbi:hypothetical protein BBJ28_00018915, partial [Nothophytophthora sp. Chile5]